jgi:hypothetical protein
LPAQPARSAQSAHPRITRSGTRQTQNKTSRFKKLTVLNVLSDNTLHKVRDKITYEEQRAAQLEELQAISDELGVPIEEVFNHLRALLDRKFPEPTYYRFSAN